jgi:hypothetical protein
MSEPVQTLATRATPLAPAQTSFADLAAGADFIPSRTLVKSGELIGVPFVITSATFRPAEPGRARGYVSLEITTSDNHDLVINDGSTGIRRQVVTYCQMKGYLTGPADPDMVVTAKDADVGGDFGPVTVTLAASADKSEAYIAIEGFRLLASQGIRVSEYSSPEFGDASTAYLS